MSFKVECQGCGQDCSNAYGTWHGYPYHIMCIPAKNGKARTSGVPPSLDGRGHYEEDAPGYDEAS